MFNLSDYDIAFEGLKERLHHFEYQLEAAFFEHIAIEELPNGNLQAKVALDKRHSMMVAEISLSGSINTFCDRCNEALEMPVNGSMRQIYKSEGRTDYEDSEEVFVIPSYEHKLNFTNAFYECMMLTLPIRRVHDDADCDPEIIAALNQTADNEKGQDPRWNALRGLTG